MRQHARAKGLTVPEVLVLVFISLLGVVFLASCFLGSQAKARDAARRMQCASNMRQIGLAVFQYEAHYVCMPNAQWNAFREAAAFVGVPTSPGEGAIEAGVTDLFRCPSDEFLPGNELWNGLSYAPIVDSGYVDGDNDDTPDGNFTYCAWSYTLRGYDADNGNDVDPNGDGDPLDFADQEDVLWQVRNLTQSAPDTAILVEFWAPTNRLDPGREVPGGYLGHNYSGDEGDDGTKTGMGTLNFSGSACAPAIKAVSDVGGYAFLSAFGKQAQVNGRAAQLKGMLHRGTMNIFFMDGSVQSQRLHDVTRLSPLAMPMWTRTAD